MSQETKIPWWSEQYGFFGGFYMEGDNSKEGYLIEKKQELVERTRVEIEGVLNLLHLESGASILDCPCGYGRHSIEFAKRGFLVTGSDINSVHLQEAKRKAGEDSVNIAFKQESMINLGYLNQFDVVINMFYSFGFFDTDAENEQVLKNFFNALKPGGKFLMHTDVNVPRILSGKYKEDEERTLTTGKTLRVIDSYNSETKRIDGAWIIKNSTGEERKDYSVRVYEREEFEKVCMRIGFSSVITYSDWNGKEYSKDSEDMIVVAIK